MELLRSERRTRNSKRKPLSDLTNTHPLSVSSSSSSPSLKPSSKSKTSNQRSSLSSNLDEISVSIGSSSPENRGDGGISKASSRAKEISTNFDASGCYKSNHSIGYTQQNAERRRDKGQVAAVALRPTERMRSIRAVKMENRNVVLPSTVSAACQKIKKKQKQTVSDDKILQEPTLPQDFIEKQRAYFAEIDSFDLVEEVVSESELE